MVAVSLGFSGYFIWYSFGFVSSLCILKALLWRLPVRGAM